MEIFLETRTDKYPAYAGLAALPIGKKTLVSLKARETNGHFGDDPCQHGTEALVEREGRFPSHNHRARREKAPWFCLWVRLGGSNLMKVL
jgi:hypothetical protein